MAAAINSRPYTTSWDTISRFGLPDGHVLLVLDQLEELFGTDQYLGDVDMFNKSDDLLPEMLPKRYEGSYEIM